MFFILNIECLYSHHRMFGGGKMFPLPKKLISLSLQFETAFEIYNQDARHSISRSQNN